MIDFERVKLMIFFYSTDQLVVLFVMKLFFCLRMTMDWDISLKRNHYGQCII